MLVGSGELLWLLVRVRVLLLVIDSTHVWVHGTLTRAQHVWTDLCMPLQV